MKSKNYKIAISAKKDGNMSFRWGDFSSVLRNRERFLEKYGFLLKKCVTTSLVHGEEVMLVNRNNAGQGMLDSMSAQEADAMMTSDPEISLFMMVADCVATVFFNKKTNVLCLAHLNGKNPGLIKSVLAKFVKEFNSDTTNITVFMSPCIKKESYIVPDPFQKQLPEWQNFTENLDEHKTTIDMVGFLRNEMIKQGINSENISISEVDTYIDKKYFSHRRSVVTGEVEGRFALVVSLEK
jgi:YfiH family protein